MSTEFNYSAGISSAGTILATGANIYLAIQQGEIKAIENEMKANERKAQQDMAALDKKSKMDQLSMQYEEQAANMAQDFAGARESQIMSAMMQGRSMDSLSSVQEGDERQYMEDQQKAMLNKQYTEGQIEADYKLQYATSMRDIESLKNAAKTSRIQGEIGAATAGLSGLTTLAKNNAFDEDYYYRKVDPEIPEEK